MDDPQSAEAPPQGLTTNTRGLKTITRGLTTITRGLTTITRGLSTISPREVAVWIAILALSAALAYSISGEHGHDHDHIVGQPLTDMKLRSTDGAVVDLEALRGETLVLNVFATWCPPCRAEIPDLSRFHTAHEGSGIKVYGVVFESGPPDQAEADSRALGVNYPLLLGNATFQRRFELHSYPTTLVVDPRGVVTHRFEGPVTEAQLEDMARPAP